MNKRERIRTAFLGGMPDKVPWTIYRGLLPQVEHPDEIGDEETEKLQERGLAVVSSAGVSRQSIQSLRF